MKHIKNFQNYKKINEVYESDVALEELFFKILGDSFLDNRKEILDNIYTVLSAHTINWSYEILCEDYPELTKYKDEFYKELKKRVN